MGVLDSVSENLSKANKNVSKASGKLFNSNPSQKSGKLGKIAQSVSGISKTATGTITSVGHTVAKIAGSLGGSLGKNISEALEGKSETKFKPEKEKDYEVTGLKAFYQRFSGFEFEDTNKIDTLNTFECTFTFYPNTEDMVNNDNGDTSFLGSVIGKKSLDKPEKSPRFDYSKNTDDSEKVDYKINSNTYLDLGMFIQSITVPQMQQDGLEEVKTMFGQFPTSGNFVQPDSKKLTMEIVNTKSSLHENFFYTWLKETTLPYWNYQSQPYTTATIELDFTEHSNVKYFFYGCRPCSVQMYQPSQEAGSNFSRQVQFTFDWMFIVGTGIYGTDGKDVSYVQTIEEAKDSSSSKSDKISKIGNAVAFAAQNILKI